MIQHRTNRNTNRAAFTAMELIVMISIVALTSTIGATAYQKLMEKGRQAREVSAARNLMIAYHHYAQDNGGLLMPGYKDDSSVENFEGDALPSPVNGRYPWRLAPYVGETETTLVYNGNEKFLEKKNRDYLVSVLPNLGINATYVGGHYGNSSLLRPSSRMEGRIGRWYISTAAESSNASRQIVFASARSAGSDGENVQGYFEVQPPKVLSQIWTEEPFDKQGNPSAHGFVDLRWGGKAVAAMLDGSVQMFTESQMRDMRHWADDAQLNDDPNYTISY